jgi:nicotinamidase-related amidase
MRTSRGARLWRMALGFVLPASAGVELAAGLLAEGSPGLDCELLLSGEAQALGAAEWAMFKPRWGAFFGASLEAMLKRLGVTTFVFCGCNFPNCPRTSIYEASERNFRIVLTEDAISGLYARGRDELAAIGVGMMSAAEIAARVAVAIP